MTVSRTDFEYVSHLIRREAAIVLDPGKEYLVESRLAPLARESGCASLGDFIEKLRAAPRTNLLYSRVIDALTTNETFFFRDHHPFEALRRHIVPDLIQKRASVRKLNVWCAASSTGQEPYSIAMLLRDAFPQLQSWNVQVLATDISSAALKLAQAAQYSQFEVNRGLPAPYLIKYFFKQQDKWCVKDDIKRMIEFRPLNLVQPWPLMPPFDLVFIRNVLIYFDVEIKKQILKKVRSCLQPHGAMFLGTSETTMNLDPAFQPVTVGSTVVFKPTSQNL